MRTNILIIIFVTIALCSCSGDTDPVYSCDKTIDSWVRNHIEEIQKMDRSDWLIMDDKLKAASFRAFTQGQKIDFWKEKLAEVMALDWNEDELEHIQKVSDFIDTHTAFFGDIPLSDEQNNELDLFFYQWATYAFEKLKWEKRTVYAIACTGLQLLSKNGDIGIIPSIAEEAEKMTKSSEQQKIPDCDCHLSAWNLMACAPQIFWGCEESECDDEPKGCGWLLGQACDGLCVPQ